MSFLNAPNPLKSGSSLPSGGSPGQVLTKTETGAEWKDPSGGLPDNVATITLSKNNDESGEVEGGGIATKGMTVKVKAVPYLENNWMFTHWSEDDEIVSQTNPYQFEVEKDRNLVANFDNTYKFGENWFLDSLYIEGSSSKITVSNNAWTFLYNPHTETFFLANGGTVYSKCLYEIYLNDETMRFEGISLVTESSLVPSYAHFTIDDDGNLWYLNLSYANGGLIKYDINTRSFSVVYPRDNLPERSTYSWRCAAYGNGVYILIDDKFNCAYSYDAVEWIITKIASVSLSSSVDLSIDLKFAGGYFVLRTSYGNGTIYYSEDGIKWVASSASSNSSTGQITDFYHMYDDTFLTLTGTTGCLVSFKNGTKIIGNTPFGSVSNGDTGMACAYGDGMFVTLRSGAAGKTTTYAYGTDIRNLKQTDPITDVVYATKPTWMRAAYGNGMILVVTANTSNIVYTTPSGPIKDQ